MGIKIKNTLVREEARQGIGGGGYIQHYRVSSVTLAYRIVDLLTCRTVVHEILANSSELPPCMRYMQACKPGNQPRFIT